MLDERTRLERGLRQLAPSVSAALEKVTIVGMRHHQGSFERIIEASKRKRPLHQGLFLVHDVNNRFDVNAVMLHDGVRKLGYVQAAQAATVRALLKAEGERAGQDVVIVVSMPPQSDSAAWSTSFNVKGVGMVYERIARKYGQSLA